MLTRKKANSQNAMSHVQPGIVILFICATSRNKIEQYFLLKQLYEFGTGHAAVNKFSRVYSYFQISVNEGPDYISEKADVEEI